jgi:hypothetical protein
VGLPEAVLALVGSVVVEGAELPHDVEGECGEVEVELAVLELRHQPGDPGRLVLQAAREHAHAVELHRQRSPLELQQAVAMNGVGHRGRPVHRLVLHQASQSQPGSLGVGIQAVALVLERGVGDLPALAAPAHDVGLGHAHVLEEHLVERVLAQVAGHGAQGLDLEPRRVHGHEQVADAGVLGGLGLGPHQREHHVRLVRGARPDLLPVDDEVVALLSRRRLQAGEVAAGARFRVALAPEHLAAHGRADPASLLLLASVLQQGGHQHGRPLGRHAAGDAGAVELLVHDHGLEQVRGRPEAPVLLRDGARPVAVLDLQGEPADAVSTLPLAGGRRLVVVQEGAHLLSELLVPLTVFEVHPFVSVWVGA